ncbi:MAG: hypothetical protein JW800_00050 [Candidatus Omnitrophica bacterium]|nr:hypothetical protein [Candidatus Omnitrophota bacterium]
MQTPAQFEKILEFAKKLLNRLPKTNIEKIVFKILAFAWASTLIICISLLIIGRFQGDVDTRIIITASSPTLKKMDNNKLQHYKSLDALLKYPEPISNYTQRITRDPFMRYEEGMFLEPIDSAEHDFVVTSIDRMLLPFVYKGFIELPDRVVGQINWNEDTIFVKDGSSLHDYTVLHVSKDVVTAKDASGMPIQFHLNEPVFSNELQAVLYDTITHETFTVHKDMQVDNYKVIDIKREYVILHAEGIETKLDNRSLIDQHE